MPCVWRGRTASRPPRLKKSDRSGRRRKPELLVRGQLGDHLRIDATLIANTSWLRGILWAFIHALREEAVEHIGGDIFPVMLLDDPQQTFDNEHRARWAEQIAKLQKGTPAIQVVLTTHDEQFLSQLNLLGIGGRQALVCSPGPEFGHIAILEGDLLNRTWQLTQQTKTPAAAESYIAAVRKYAEGILKLMLRGMDPSIPTAVLGKCREKISEFHDQGIEPWNRPAFSGLVSALAKNRKEIKWMEEAHHSSTPLTMTEAADVEKHWRETLRPTLERCFKIIRDHRALHGGLTALHAFPPSVSLPEGHKAKVRQFKLPLLGTAAALSDGRVADGCVDLHFAVGASATVELKDHFIFRLTKPTLEPVARPQDLLLVQDSAPVTPLSRPCSLSSPHFEIHNPVWHRVADELGDKGAPDIVLFDRGKTAGNQAPQPGHIVRRVSIACDNSGAKNRETLEACRLNHLFLQPMTRT